MFALPVVFDVIELFEANFKHSHIVTTLRLPVVHSSSHLGFQQGMISYSFLTARGESWAEGSSQWIRSPQSRRAALEGAPEAVGGSP